MLPIFFYISAACSGVFSSPFVGATASATLGLLLPASIHHFVTMGNAPSSEELRIQCRRRLSKPQATSSWVQIAGENDYDGVPTTPLSGSYYGLDDAIPTVPGFALLQSQSLSGSQWPKNSATLGPEISAAAACYKSRPSRHSTDAFHPLRSAPVSGSARAACMEEDEALGNDAENSRIDDRYFSSPPALSSSSSTESWRTLSSASNTSRELPLYIPYRRRSLQQIPGLATRPEKPESDAATHRPSLPTSPIYYPYSPSVQADSDFAAFPRTPAPDGDLDDLGNSFGLGYRQLGSIKFGSLRITNGSPLSMRQPDVNTDEAADLDGDMVDNGTLSDEAANSHPIIPSDSLPTDSRNDLTLIELPADSSNAPPHDCLDTMHAGETTRGRQGRFSSENPRISVETARARIPSVIDDEQLKLIRRQSRRVTSDDSSSVYSDNAIPVMLSDDIAQHEQTHNDNSNGPHLSFQSFRNLIRQNRVKSYLQANNKATVIERPFHQRSASDQDSIHTATRSPSRSRRKLAKKSPGIVLPPDNSSSNTETYNPDATKPRPLPPQVTDDQSSGHQNKGHASSNSDGQVSQMRFSRYKRGSTHRLPRQSGHSLRNHLDGYQTTSERVPIVLGTPRAHVSFEGDLPKKTHGPTRVEQMRLSQTTEFKPLPTPKPDLPQRRRPVRVPVPISTGVGPRESGARQNRYSSSPSHVRSNTMPQVTQYKPYNDGDNELRLYSPNNDNPYVSPLSDDDDDLWPLPRDTSSKTATRPSSSFEAREVSPIRHAISMPSIHNSPERPLRTPAPLSAHSRRAQELAERWQQQQQPPQPPRASLEYPRFSTFYEHASSNRPTTAGALDDDDDPLFLFVERDASLPPIVYRNGTRRGAEVSSTMWRPPYRVLHSYYSPAYRNAPIWG